MANISTTDLPAYTSQYTKTTQTIENYTLKSGRIYHFEVWGAKGGNGCPANNNNGGAGGNGSYAHGWYDMRSLDSMTATIFTGGTGETCAIGMYRPGVAGWGATQLGTQLKGTPGGSGRGNTGGGGGGSASGILLTHPIIQGGFWAVVAGGGAGGGGGGGITGGGKGGGLMGNNSASGHGGATESAHGAAGYSASTAGSAAGGGTGGSGWAGGGGGAGGGYTQGFAGGGGIPDGGGGGGSGGTSYTGGVQSLKNSNASFTWAHPNATGNGKVVITEYVMSVNVATPISTDDCLVSSPSKTAVSLGGAYTFTITREVGVGHVGLQLNSASGALELTSTNGKVFTYTVSNVQGAITSSDFSVTTYNVNAPPDGTGYTISPPSSTNVIMGGVYSFVITFTNGHTQAFVKINTPNGKVNYGGIDMNTITVTISNVQGEIMATDFTITVSRV